jgi:hypothetical protein
VLTATRVHIAAVTNRDRRFCIARPYRQTGTVVKERDSIGSASL